MILIFTTLSVNSVDHKFLYFPITQILTFRANCLHFYGKHKKTLNTSSAKSLTNMLSIKCTVNIS